MYPKVSSWYALKNDPDNIFIGVGDAPGRCHIVLTNTHVAHKAYSGLIGTLRSIGFVGYDAPNGQASTLFVHKTPSENMLVLLTGLTDAQDEIGPQVSVDVSTASDAQLRGLLRTQ